MLRKALDMKGFTVFAIDGEVGPLLDLYFDDQDYTIRYLVVDGSDLDMDQNLLISPQAIKYLDWENRKITFALTQKKILNSPELETDLPISRQYEIALRRYYEWPLYWGQTSLLDTPLVKDLEQQQIPLDEEDREEEVSSNTDNEEVRFIDEDEREPDSTMISMPLETDDSEVVDMEFAKGEQEGIYNPQLRSITDLCGYHIHTSIDESGSVDDFILDDTEWNIRYLAVNTRGAHRGKMVLLALHWIKNISWGSSHINITLTREDLENSPSFNPSTPVTQDYEKMLFDYYDTLNY